MVLPGKACIYPLFTSYFCYFLFFFPLFLFLSQVQRNIAPCRLPVLCWFVHKSHFCVFSVPNKGWEENLKLRPCRFECVCEFRIHRQDMKYELAILLLLCTFLLHREQETRGCSHVWLLEHPLIPWCSIVFLTPFIPF